MWRRAETGRPQARRRGGPGRRRLRNLGTPPADALGATDDEAAGPYPGAGVVPEGERAGTMAVTIEAPPEEVWPWLVPDGLEPRGLVFLGPPRQRRPAQRHASAP